MDVATLPWFWTLSILTTWCVGGSQAIFLWSQSHQLMLGYSFSKLRYRCNTQTKQGGSALHTSSCCLSHISIKMAKKVPKLPAQNRGPVIL